MAALDMDGQVAVAQCKPVCAADLLQCLHAVPGFVGSAPASLLVILARQPVQDGIKIGADGQAEMFEVVAGVDRKHQLPWVGQDGIEPTGQLGTAHASTQSKNTAGWRGMCESGVCHVLSLFMLSGKGPASWGVSG